MGPVCDGKSHNGGYTEDNIIGLDDEKGGSNDGKGYCGTILDIGQYEDIAEKYPLLLRNDPSAEENDTRHSNRFLI